MPKISEAEAIKSVSALNEELIHVAGMDNYTAMCYLVLHVCYHGYLTNWSDLCASGTSVQVQQLKASNAVFFFFFCCNLICFRYVSLSL